MLDVPSTICKQPTLQQPSGERTHWTALDTDPLSSLHEAALMHYEVLFYPDIPLEVLWNKGYPRESGPNNI